MPSTRKDAVSGPCCGSSMGSPSRSGCLPSNEPTRHSSGFNEMRTMILDRLTFRLPARIVCGLSNKPSAVLSARYEKRIASTAGIPSITQSLSRSTGRLNRHLKDVIARQSRPTSPSCTKKQHSYVMYDRRSERVAADLGSIGDYPNVETGITRSPQTYSLG